MSTGAHGTGSTGHAYRADTKLFLRGAIERKESALEQLRCLERWLEENAPEAGSAADNVIFEAVAALVNSGRL